MNVLYKVCCGLDVHKKKLDNIVTAMNGIITPFQKEIIKEVVSHINDMTERINRMDEIIERYMKKT